MSTKAEHAKVMIISSLVLILVITLRLPLQKASPNPLDGIALSDLHAIQDPPYAISFGREGGGGSSIEDRPLTTSGFHDDSPVNRLLSRIRQAGPNSILHQQRSKIVQAVQRAEVVERVHIVNFRPGYRRLDQRDVDYLVSAVQNHAKLQQHRKHPFSKILVLGYASKDGDSRNNFFALDRSLEASKALQGNKKLFGFDGDVFSWCVGETDLLSRETNWRNSDQNRAAEIWLVVSNDPIFSQIGSDKLP